MRSFAYYGVCLACIVILFWSAPASVTTLVAGIVLLGAFFACLKGNLVDQKKLREVCGFYEQAHSFDELYLLKNERPYQKILNIVVQIGKFDWAVLFLMDFEKDSFTAVESSGISLERFSSIGFDEIELCGSTDGMTLSVKLLEHAFKTHELQGALAGSAIEKNGVYYGCLLVGREDLAAALTESDNLSLNVLSDQISISLHNYRMHNEMAFRAEQLAERQAQINKELGMAKLVQDQAISLTPPEFSGLKIASFAKPARFVGGDFLKFYSSSESSEMKILIGDVCGKGIPAALVMAVVLCLFQEKLSHDPEPAELMCQVNLALKEFLGAGSKFNSTALFGAFNPARSSFKYASAGHDFPFLFKAGAETFIELESTGTLLGIFSESEFTSREIQLEKGDLIVFYSDGLVDFFEEYSHVEDGYPVLQEFLLQRKDANPQEIVNEIKQMVEVGNTDWKDDITVSIIGID